MSRWIDADAFKQELKENYVFYGFSYLLNDFYVAIDEAPSIDLVRCAECKRANYELSGVYCGLSDVNMGEDGFCSIGVRKESK